MEIFEFAKLLNVPILKTGRFYPRGSGPEGVEISEASLDEMIQSFEACKDLIQESIVSGIYRENPDLMKNLKKLGKEMIPAFLNLNHQRFLKDTMKTACKDIVVSFGKQVIGGANWLVATLDRVPADIAQYLKERYPLRSIETLKELYHPDKKTTFYNVPRAISFLDPTTLTPAVSGQNPHLHIEFQAEDSVITLFSSVESTEEEQQRKQSEEVSIMAEDKKDKKDLQTPVTPSSSPSNKEHKDGEQVSVHEFEKMKTKIAEFERQTKEAKIEVAAAKAEAKTAQEQWQTECQKREAAEIVQFCKNLQHEQHASPSAIKLIQPILGRLDNSAILEFAEDKKQTARQAVEDVFRSLICMKKDDSLTVPMGEFAADAVETGETQPTRSEQQKMKIVEFEEAAKSQATNPNDAEEVFGLAYAMAIAESPSLFG